MVRLLGMGQVLYEEALDNFCPFCFLCPLRTQQEDSESEPASQTSPEINHTGGVILVLKLPELWKINGCCLSSSICSALLEKLSGLLCDYLGDKSGRNCSCPSAGPNELCTRLDSRDTYHQHSQFQGGTLNTMKVSDLSSRVICKCQVRIPAQHRHAGPRSLVF